VIGDFFGFFAGLASAAFLAMGLSAAIRAFVWLAR
jgi:hypothetical protein